MKFEIGILELATKNGRQVFVDHTLVSEPQSYRIMQDEELIDELLRHQRLFRYSKLVEKHLRHLQQNCQLPEPEK
ncbi:unnamed protein product [Larinioides sclopetarius]|uniref:Uncharacterized protein n=1 Tax=Larinioides sclopetarius TaxID=280406 RepID=A0AAV1ZH23_9ARAC